VEKRKHGAIRHENIFEVFQVPTYVKGYIDVTDGQTDRQTICCGNAGRPNNWGCGQTQLILLTERFIYQQPGMINFIFPRPMWILDCWNLGFDFWVFFNLQKLKNSTCEVLKMLFIYCSLYKQNVRLNIKARLLPCGVQLCTNDVTWQWELVRYVLLCLSVDIGHLSVNKQVQDHEAAATSCPLGQLQIITKRSTSAGEVNQLIS